MKIKIKKDAACIYVNSLPGIIVNWEWVRKLEQIEGTTVEVETEWLFKNQFNTVPIPNVSKSGMRIMQNLVDEVIDDIRPQKMRCNWCGRISDKGLMCEYCGKKRYLEYL